MTVKECPKCKGTSFRLARVVVPYSCDLDYIVPVHQCTTCGWNDIPEGAESNPFESVKSNE